MNAFFISVGFLILTMMASATPASEDSKAGDALYAEIDRGEARVFVSVLKKGESCAVEASWSSPFEAEEGKARLSSDACRALFAEFAALEGKEKLPLSCSRNRMEVHLLSFQRKKQVKVSCYGVTGLGAERFEEFAKHLMSFFPQN